MLRPVSIILQHRPSSLYPKQLGRAAHERFLSEKRKSQQSDSAHRFPQQWPRPPGPPWPEGPRRDRPLMRRPPQNGIRGLRRRVCGRQHPKARAIAATTLPLPSSSPSPVWLEEITRRRILPAHSLLVEVPREIHPIHQLHLVSPANARMAAGTTTIPNLDKELLDTAPKSLARRLLLATTIINHHLRGQEAMHLLRNKQCRFGSGPI